VTETHSAINALRQRIAILSDVLGLAAECGRSEIHTKYATIRRELTGELHGAVDAGLNGHTLTDEDAARALSPIASMETARVF
jgi:hypothetical protein